MARHDKRLCLYFQGFMKEFGKKKIILFLAVFPVLLFIWQISTFTSLFSFYSLSQSPPNTK